MTSSDGSRRESDAIKIGVMLPFCRLWRGPLNLLLFTLSSAWSSGLLSFCILMHTHDYSLWLLIPKQGKSNLGDHKNICKVFRTLFCIISRYLTKVFACYSNKIVFALLSYRDTPCIHKRCNYVPLKLT